MSRPAVNPEVRFWKFVTKTASCWLWNGSVGRDGYGQFRDTPTSMSKAHRYSFKLSKGVIPEDLYVCHSCDNRRCVNPDHLWLGTLKDNMQDAKSKGRLKVLSGSLNPMFGKTGCLNPMFGKAGFGGKKHTTETKELMSKSQLRRYRNEV